VPGRPGVRLLEPRPRRLLRRHPWRRLEQRPERWPRPPQRRQRPRQRPRRLSQTWPRRRLRLPGWRRRPQRQPGLPQRSNRPGRRRSRPWHGRRLGLPGWRRRPNRRLWPRRRPWPRHRRQPLTRRPGGLPNLVHWLPRPQRRRLRAGPIQTIIARWPAIAVPRHRGITWSGRRLIRGAWHRQIGIRRAAGCTGATINISHTTDGHAVRRVAGHVGRRPFLGSGRRSVILVGH
jgi:hypothetical protein